MTLDPVPLYLTFKLATISSLVLFLLALPLIFWLFFTKSAAGTAVRVFVNMPLVLPPVVVGFYLLLLFSPLYAPGHILRALFHTSFVFTFEGLVVGSVLVNLPFMVNPILSGLESLPRSLCEASFVLGKSRRTTFLRVLLPSVKPAIVTGIVLSFAHTIGEFGVVLMIGGNIPGVTRVASIAVFDQVESLNFGPAHFYSAALVLISFMVLLSVHIINKRFTRAWV